MVGLVQDDIPRWVEPIDYSNPTLDQLSYDSPWNRRAVDEGWLVYNNSGATRNLPLHDSLVGALDFLPELGVQFRVNSAGQVPAYLGSRRTGSTRHDYGLAGDGDFYQGDTMLDWRNPDHQPILEQIVRIGRARGLTGLGVGDGYMRDGRWHVGYGNEAIWGAGGSGANAAPWLQEVWALGPAESPYYNGQAPTMVAQAGPALTSNGAIALSEFDAPQPTSSGFIDLSGGEPTDNSAISRDNVVALAPTASTRAPTLDQGGSIQAQVYNGLIARGLPEHIAQGFMMNFQNESGFDPSVVERVPNVHGTRGRGLYQLTGSRRNQFEELYGRGEDAYSIDNQLDFLMWELQNTEGRAWRNLQNTTNPGEAGAVIVRDFLRPAAEHRDRRMSEYRSGQGYMFSPDGSGQVVPVTAAPEGPPLTSNGAIAVDALTPPSPTGTLDTWTSTRNPDISLTQTMSNDAGLQIDPIAQAAEAVPVQSSEAPMAGPNDINQVVTQLAGGPVPPIPGLNTGGAAFLMPEDLGGGTIAVPAPGNTAPPVAPPAAAADALAQESDEFQLSDEFMATPEPVMDSSLVEEIMSTPGLSTQQRGQLMQMLEARHQEDVQEWRQNRDSQRRNLTAQIMRGGIDNLDLTNPREASEWAVEQARASGLYDDAELMEFEQNIFGFFNGEYAGSRMFPEVRDDARLAAQRESAVQTGNQAVRNTDLGQVVTRSERYEEDPAGRLISDFEEFGSEEWSRRDVDLMIDDFAQQFGVSRHVAAAAIYETFQEQVLPQGIAESAVAALPFVGMRGFERRYAGDLERRFQPEQAAEIIANYAGGDVSIPQAFQDFNQGFAAIEEGEAQLLGLETEIMALRSQQARIQDTLGSDSAEAAAIGQEIQALMDVYEQIATQIQNTGRR